MVSCWLVACAAILAVTGVVRAQELDWWQKTILYQIYPRSYQDSNGDGTGDLIGITSRLEHLKDLGVDAMWMSPIFTSPMVDFGYDIADFKAIDPLFGTMEDYDALIVKAKELGIKVIMDLVPNHSSDESEWFIKSVANDPDYADYYVWRDPSGFDGEGKPIPPNNWISVFYGPAWTYREERQQFYLHQFHYKQPDLNYREPKVVQEIKDVFTFWLDKGADGFRIDAIPHVFEDDQFLDEPRSNDPNAQPGDHSYLNHIYTTNQEETFDMVTQWRALVDEYSMRDNVTRVIMTEAYADIDTTMRYYGTPENPGAHFTFNFEFITDMNRNSTAQVVADNINRWMDKMPSFGTANWVAGNHDQSRVASRYGLELADGITMLIQMLPGIGVTYNGEEIGMLDTFISWEDTQDPQGCGAGPDRYQDASRDPNRTPFQWDDTQNAGFSTADKTWLPVNENYPQLNLAVQKGEDVSHYSVYKRVAEARKTATVQRGSLTVKVLADRVISFSRELAGEDTFIVVVNMGNTQEIADLKENYSMLPDQLTVFAASIDSHLNIGNLVTSTAVPLRPKAGLVLTGTPVGTARS